MAFWGVLVKPGKPVTHSCEKAHGRLRITQAMLGFGEATKKTIVQCNVGKRIPVLLCDLVPDKKECCQLDLEFAEADDVIFSVIGPRSIYLIGYYVAESRRISGPQSDSESFGVDIQNSHSEGSSHHTDDDDYEDSFIDDGELEVLPPSPASSNKSMDESESESNKQKAASKKSRRRLRKKSQMVVSDNESDSHENDDESVFRDKPSEKKSTSKVQEGNAKSTAETGENPKDYDLSDDDDDGYLLSVFKNKRDVKQTMSKAEVKKDQVAAETRHDANDNGLRDSKVKEEDGLQVARGQDESGAELPQHNMVTRVKNKRKKLSKEAETTQEASVNKDNASSDGNILGNAEEHNTNNQNIPTSDKHSQIDICKQKRKRKESSKKEKKTCDVDIDMDHSVVKEGNGHEAEPSKNMDSNSGHKSKKRKKEPQVEGKSTDGMVETCHVPSCDKPGQGLLDTDSSMKDQPEASGVSVGEKTNNESGKKKKKRSKKKTQDDNQATTEIPDTKRTLSNGLSIEVLANGEPDGKVAAPGKKVKLHYTAMVKETGHIFDSNVGKTALKFRLGNNEFSDEWNAGIDGMHVGEKRRLVVPPTLRIKNDEENVPPNSWLVYDVELVNVH